MNIHRIVPFSTVDVLGMPSITIFTAGCNLRCQFCHNWRLIGSSGTTMLVDDIVKYVSSHSRFVKCVVISGGEPTIQPDLIDVITAIKRASGLKVFVNSNGTNFETIVRLASVCDGISIDFKTIHPDRIPGYTSDVIDTVHKSIRYISSAHKANSSFLPEVRITMVEPMVSLSELPLILTSFIVWSFSGVIILQEFDKEYVNPDMCRGLKKIDVDDVISRISSIHHHDQPIYIRSLTAGVTRVELG